MVNISLVIEVAEQAKANMLAHIRNFEKTVGSAKISWLISNATSIHRIIGNHLRRTAVDIWKLGKILAKEKEIVAYGEWLKHCASAHPEISHDSIERYVRVSRIAADQLPMMLDKTPSQAYRMLDMLKEKQSPVIRPGGQEVEDSDSAKLRNLDDKPTWAITCPSCSSAIQLVRNGDHVTARLVNGATQ